MVRGGILLPRVREMCGDDGNNNRPSREVSSANVEVCGNGSCGEFFGHSLLCVVRKWYLIQSGIGEYSFR